MHDEFESAAAINYLNLATPDAEKTSLLTSYKKLATEHQQLNKGTDVGTGAHHHHRNSSLTIVDAARVALLRNFTGKRRAQTNAHHQDSRG